MLAYVVLAVLWFSIIAYATLGGADFGGGVWNFFANGANAKQQRDLINNAIQPVWEANNVWIIYLVVGLLVTFPVVLSTLAVALFVPFSLALIGIVLRGASFAFRAHFARAVPVRAVWSRAFGIASTITPFVFGACAAGVASGNLHLRQGVVQATTWSVWLTPFTITIGALAVALCATIAACFLTVEAQTGHNQPMMAAFRRRGLLAGAIMAGLGLLAFLQVPFAAPLLWQGMVARGWPLAALTTLAGVGCAAMLWLRHYQSARALIVGTTALLLAAWGVAQMPYIIPPDITVLSAASPSTTLWQFLLSVSIGMALLLPSLWFLFHTFKGPGPMPAQHLPELKDA